MAKRKKDAEADKTEGPGDEGGAENDAPEATTVDEPVVTAVDDSPGPAGGPSNPHGV